MTETGERLVEDLQVGDWVWTADHGFQPIRWRGTREVSARDLAKNPKLRPVCIRANALGSNRPERDLTVSPQHRILLRSAIAQRMFSADELLVAAKDLTGVPGIEQVQDVDCVTYIHLLFDQHEVLLSNGAETESLYPGPQALISLGEAAQEVFELFPALQGMTTPFPQARPFVAGKKARHMASRHVANGHALAG